MKILLAALLLMVTPFAWSATKKPKSTCEKIFEVEVQSSLSIVELLGSEKSKDVYKKAYAKIEYDYEGQTLMGLQLKEQLGEGYRADVWSATNGQVFKVAESAKSSFKLYLESVINSDLKSHYARYGILTDDILSVGPESSYLEKELLDKEQFADEILKRKKQLSNKQLKALEKLFRGAVLYAEETGIGLDIKSANLWWNQSRGEWVLFDCGPRTSYIPYGFTLDRADFQDYLSEWTEEEPPEQ